MLCRLSPPRPCLLLLIGILAAMLVPAAHAQDERPLIDDRPRVPRAPEENPPSQSLLGNDPLQGVYVRDSAAAVEQLVLAQRMERLKEWNKAADIYQEILRNFTDRVVPSQVDQDNRIYQYTSVTAAVQERLAKWPAQGLNVYRGLFEPEAQQLLEQAQQRDLATLHRVYSNYFVTESARSAALRLIDLYIESGEFSAAAWIGDRLLRLHPDLQEHRPQLLYRTAMAYHLAGSSEAAKEKLAQLKSDHADAKGTIRGEEVTLAESLASQLDQPVAAAGASARDSWPMAFGSPDRARVPDVSASGGARLFSIELTAPQLQRVQAQQERAALEERYQSDRMQGQMTGVMPVVDRGELFFQDNVRIYAVSLESGLPLPGWANTYPGAQQGRYTIDGGWPLPRNQQLTVTLTNDSVLAIMGQGNRIDEAMSFPGRRNTRLVCLDRNTGAQKWIIQPSRLPDEAAHLRELDLSGSPLVVADQVLVTARGGKGLQFEDCYVLSFDLASGQYKWSCYIASANTHTQLFDGNINNMTDTLSHLAYANGRVYVLTNLGAVAAVDAYDGTIIWLNIYPREAAAEPRGRRFGGGGWTVTQRRTPRKPWSFNPVIVSEGHVFLLPVDSRHVFVYDAGTGLEAKRIKTSDFDNATTMIGVLGERLILSSDKVISCANWRGYNPDSFDQLNEEMVFWISSNRSEDMRGRPFLTRQWLYYTTTDRLWQVNVSNGLRDFVYPRARPKWDDQESPGNVLVTQDQIILAGPERLDVYTDLQLVQRKLDAVVAEAPTQPEPRLRYAEMMFVAGHVDLAAQKLDEAIELMGGIGSMSPGPARDQVFSIAMTFARKLLRPDQPPPQRELVDALFDRAAAAATSPAQQVEYRLERARFAARLNQPQMQVQLYQQILLDPQLRSVAAVQDEETGTLQAGIIAERAINDVMNRAGRGAYAPFEQEAQKQAEIALASSKPDELLAVAQTYPNSNVAATVMLAAADAYEAAGNARKATHVLREIYLKYPRHPDKARVLEAQARNYLAMPDQIEVAIARLTQGARLPENPRLTQPLTLPDGRTIENVTFNEALSLLQEYHSQQQAAALPDFGLPQARLTERQRRSGAKPPEPFARPENAVISRIAQLVVPDEKVARHDRIVALTRDGALEVYQPGQAQPLFSSRSLAHNGQQLGAAWVGENLLAWNGEELVLLAADGKSLWQVALKALPSIGSSADAGPAAPEVLFRRPQRGPAQPEMIALVRPLADRVVVGTSRSRVAAIDLHSGELIWQNATSPRLIERLLATEDWVVLQASDESTMQLIALDAFTGSVAHRRSFSRANNEPTPTNLVLSPDGKMVYLLPDQLCAKDLFEPGDALLYSHPGIRGDSRPAYGAVQPDQLIIADARILLVAENGQFVHVHSLETGRLLQFDSPDQETSISGRLATRSKDPGVKLRVVSPRLYAIGPRSLTAYNLDNPADSWGRVEAFAEEWRTSSTFIGVDHLIAVEEFIAEQQDRPRRARLTCFSRALYEGRESGLLNHVYDVVEPAGLLQWQPVSSGLYYLAGDGKLHFLKGSRP